MTKCYFCKEEGDYICTANLCKEGEFGENLIDVCDECMDDYMRKHSAVFCTGCGDGCYPCIISEKEVVETNTLAEVYNYMDRTTNYGYDTDYICKDFLDESGNMHYFKCKDCGEYFFYKNANGHLVEEYGEDDELCMQCVEYRWREKNLE